MGGFAPASSLRPHPSRHQAGTQRHAEQQDQLDAQYRKVAADSLDREKLGRPRTIRSAPDRRDDLRHLAYAEAGNADLVDVENSVNAASAFALYISEGPPPMYTATAKVSSTSGFDAPNLTNAFA